MSDTRTNIFRKLFFSVSSKVFFLVLGLTLMTASLVGASYYFQISRLAADKDVQTLVYKGSSLAHEINMLYTQLGRNAQFLSMMPPVHGLARSLQSGGVDPIDHSTLGAWENRLEIIFNAMLETRPFYVQVRFLGLADKGREIVRVHRMNGKVEVVADEDLQEKEGEPYFQEGLRIDRGQIYFTDINLNREFGLVTTPYLPVIRAITPIFDDKGKRFGMIVINVDHDQLIQSVLAEKKLEEGVYLVNGKGDYLYHPDKSRTFGFEFGKDQKIQNDFPELAGALENGNSQQVFFLNRQGKNIVAYFSKIVPNPDMPERFIGLILLDSQNVLLAGTNEAKRRAALLTGVMTVVAMILSYLLSRILSVPLNRIIDEVRAYGRGRKTLALPVGRKDELGELAGAFEEVIGNLEKSRTAEKMTLNRLQAVLDNTVDGLITIDTKGTVLSYNKACGRIFGYEPAEVVGNNIKMLMPEPHQHQHDEYLRNYLATGITKIIGTGRELEALRKNGETFPIELSVAEVMVDGNRIFSGIIRDITDRRKAEEEITRSNLELERFAYIASHDLQEPLRMIANFTSLLKEDAGAELGEKANQYTVFIIDAVARMQELVNDLLEYSRLQNEDSGAKDVDCNAIMSLVLQNLSEGIEETKAEVTFSDLPTIRANPVRLTRLLQNLVGNAIKYRRKDRAPKIHVKAADQGGEWLISVRDNGIGIKQEYLKSIFVIFKRLHSSKEYSGTGIGLAICQKVAESFGGRIWAESEYGQGSVFYFTIPKGKGNENHDDGQNDDERANAAG